jgi:hypothetical protein
MIDVKRKCYVDDINSDEITTDNRDMYITEVHGTKEIMSIQVWDLMVNLIENQTEDTYYVDKLEELKSELELHLEEKE